MTGMSALILFVFPSLRGDDGEVLIRSTPLSEAAGFVFGSMAPVLAGAVIILFQGAVIQEMKNGTAAWILSKPAGRNSYILAKALSGAMMVLLILTAMPLGLTRLLLTFYEAHSFPAAAYFGASAMLLIYLLFHLSLVLFLGTAVKSEGAAGGSGIGIMLAFTIALELVPALRPAAPWSLPGISLMLLNGAELPSWGLFPAVSSVALSALLLGGALVRFGRKEIRA